MISNAAAEQELRELVAERVAAVHTRDATTLAARRESVPFDPATGRAEISLRPQPGDS